MSISFTQIKAGRAVVTGVEVRWRASRVEDDGVLKVGTCSGRPVRQSAGRQGGLQPHAPQSVTGHSLSPT